MPFEWEHYRDFADDLCYYDYDNEAALRSAISRAYYSAFNLAQKLLNEKQRPVSNKGTGMHERLWATFAEEPNSIWQSIATNGERLREKRTRVDYFLEHKLNPKTIELLLKEAEGSVKTANFILGWIEQIKTHTEPT